MRTPLLIIMVLMLAGLFLRGSPPDPQPVADGWWSDGTLRIDVDDSASLEALYEARYRHLELESPDTIEGLLPATVSRLDLSCQRSKGDGAHWVGYLYPRGPKHGLPLASICTGGPDVTAAKAEDVCSAIRSRGVSLRLISFTRRSYVCGE